MNCYCHESATAYILELFFGLTHIIVLMLGNLHLVKNTGAFHSLTVRIADLISPFSTALRLFDQLHKRFQTWKK